MYKTAINYDGHAWLSLSQPGTSGKFTLHVSALEELEQLAHQILEAVANERHEMMQGA